MLPCFVLTLTYVFVSLSIKKINWAPPPHAIRVEHTVEKTHIDMGHKTALATCSKRHETGCENNGRELHRVLDSKEDGEEGNATRASHATPGLKARASRGHGQVAVHLSSGA